jgi:hypothetical protein
MLHYRPSSFLYLRETARAQNRTLTLQLLCDFELRFMGPDFSLWTIELEQFNRRAVINDESDRHAFAGGL